MKNVQPYLLRGFATLTVLLDGALLAHWLSAALEWLVFLSAVVTAVLAFLQSYKPFVPPAPIPTSTPTPPPTPIPTPPPKKG